MSPTKAEYFNAKYFGEGVTLFNDHSYIALTWMDKKFLIIDRNTLKVTEERPIPSKIV